MAQILARLKFRLKVKLSRVDMPTNGVSVLTISSSACDVFITSTPLSRNRTNDQKFCSFSIGIPVSKQRNAGRNARTISSFNRDGRSSMLGQTEVFMQSGLKISELPLVVKKVNDVLQLDNGCGGISGKSKNRPKEQFDDVQSTTYLTGMSILPRPRMACQMCSLIC